MKEFLRLVAEHYWHQSAANNSLPKSAALADMLFVFPNRRSGIFFNHYLSEVANIPLIAPATTTIGELFGRFSDLRLSDRTSLLFRLYQIYKTLGNEAEDFDKFIFWGDMLLADFDDIDKYLVNARSLFVNMADLKKLEEEFAGYDEETINVIQHFWQVIQQSEDEFNETEKENKKRIFEQMWSILFDLYSRFKKSLFEENQAYEGMMQRYVVEKIQTGDTELIDQVCQSYRQIVFVGLNAISRTERELMKWLQKKGKASFCWDYADKRLQPAQFVSQAAYFTADNLQDFPNVLSETELSQGLVPDKDRKIEVLSVSSAVGQTEWAAAKLQTWMQEGVIDPTSENKSDPSNAFHTAVVLPDEKLLIPMLYAMPDGLTPFNVTMGYGLKSTPIAALIETIVRLQSEARVNDVGEETFFYKHVLSILSHHFVMALEGEEVQNKAAYITKNNLYRVPASLFDTASFIKLIFRRCKSALEAKNYINEIFDYLMQEANKAVEDEDGVVQTTEVFDPFGRELLCHYVEHTKHLNSLVDAFPENFGAETYFFLLQRLMQGVSVPFSGEPLAGLQVMGVLETRAVDFENVIVLSMNEGIFPAKPISNTFIPMTLRKAFGLPTHNHRDAVFAYHFYRLISRAKRVVLLYDSRTDGMQTGEQSRYLMQLRYLYGIPLEMRSVSHEIGVSESQSFMIKKTQEIMQSLSRFRSGGTAQLSATALKTYIKCPLMFYFHYVEGLKEVDDVSEQVDAKQFGIILHDVMTRLYDNRKGKEVTSDYIHCLLKNKDVVEQSLKDSFCAAGFGAIQGYVKLIYEILQTYINNVLNRDLQLCPFTYIDSEYEQHGDYKVNENLSVRYVCIYDRLDITRDGCLRIVDYKTSHYKDSKTIVKSLDHLFESRSDFQDEAFQVMLYCLWLKQCSDNDCHQLKISRQLLQRIAPHLYFLTVIHQDDNKTSLTMKRADGTSGEVANFAYYETEFKDKFDSMLIELFDANVPFTQCEDSKVCSYCPFLSICKREVPKN